MPAVGPDAAKFLPRRRSEIHDRQQNRIFERAVGTNRAQRPLRADGGAGVVCPAAARNQHRGIGLVLDQL